MQSTSKSQENDSLFTSLKAKGLTGSIENLYLFEVERLRNSGYNVEIVKPHPLIKNLSRCLIIYPKQG